jgi:membrane-associated protease RseP (regulator of RpoE activity)
MERKLERLEAKLAGRDDEAARLAGLRARLAASQLTLAQHRQRIDQLQVFPGRPGDDDGSVGVLDGEDASWLGVELREVTGETAKDLKLPAERGVVVSSVVPDSPAAKAGLKENDVVTEISGQHVEGAVQFRRMIREIPAGRTVQLTLWRDGHAQTLSVTLGKGEERHRSFKVITPGPGAPGSFTFNMPEIPMVPPMEWDGSRFLAGGQARLGIDAEDLNGQLGTFFGAPDGEGILVRGVNAGSPAEKAGVKAGDVITSVNGERVRTVGDLREKLLAKRGAKEKDQGQKDQRQSVTLGVLRNKSEVSLTVELPAPTSRSRRAITFGVTSI